MVVQDSWTESERFQFPGGGESAEFLPAVAGGVVLASLVSMFAMLVMMTSTAPTQSKDDVSSGEDDDAMKSCRRVAARRFRSLSVSVDLQYSADHSCDEWNGSATEAGWQRQQLKVLSGSGDRYRTMSTNYIERYRALHHADCADLTMWKAQGLEMLRRVPEAFPFQSLPVDCRLKVFSMLSAVERGRAARVCKDWCALMRLPELWTNVDFLSFAFCRRCARTGRDCTPLCYAAYKTRMKSFFRFLFSVRPKIRRLRASFDIGHHRDGWLDQLQGLVHTARCQDLIDVDLNWKETPLKPVSFSLGCNATWSTGDYYDLVYQHRHRQRLFVKFFDVLAALAPNIRRLTMPFDWSERSVRTLSRLRQLESLTLHQYFWMQSVDPYFVEQVVAGAPALRTLYLEIWSPSGNGLQSYTVRSPSLEHLDVSQSRGFCLGDVSLPRLRSIVVSRQPMSGPLSDSAPHPLPCLLHVLSTGAPALDTLNGYQLPSGWNTDSSVENEALESVLKTVCACAVHKPA